MKIRSPFLIRTAAAAIAGMAWLLFRTLRLNFRMEDPVTNPYEDSTAERFLYCVWHDSMVVPTFSGKHHHAAALISQHADGSVVAQVLRRVGMQAIRGSTNRITPGAIRELIKVAECKHLVITPDGPRGPNRQVSMGILYLASRTGRAIIPTAYSCSRHWRIKGSWSDLIIPKPFSNVYLLAGHPVRVPPDLRASELEPYLNQLQQEMDRLNAWAAQLASGASASSDQGVDSGSSAAASPRPPYFARGSRRPDRTRNR